MNAALGQDELEALDLVIAAARELGLKIILDNHSRKPDDFINEGLWYTPTSRRAAGSTTGRRSRRAIAASRPWSRSICTTSRTTSDLGRRPPPTTPAAERAAAAIHSVHPDVI
jgi:hypothetical protein